MQNLHEKNSCMSYSIFILKHRPPKIIIAVFTRNICFKNFCCIAKGNKIILKVMTRMV
jgi:hypothetical protein